MRERVLAAFLALALCAGLAGCAGGSPPGGRGPVSSDSGYSAPLEPLAYASEVYVGLPQDLDGSLDPHKAVTAGTREVLFNVFEGLLKLTPGGGLTPAVAQDYTVSSDGTAYIFTLRPGVLFHNGTPVTAEDVRYSLARCASDGEPGVVPVPAFANIRDIETPDSRTVSVTLDRPDGEFPYSLTAAVLPADYPDQDAAPVGTGPFRVAARTPGETLVLERFEDYWGVPAKMDRVTCRVIDDAARVVMSLQSGTVDLFPHLTAAQAMQLNEENFDVAQGSMNLVQALFLNNAAEPFTDPRVRQALCCAVDRRAVVETAFQGFGTPVGSGLYPAFSDAFDETLTDLYPYNPERARSLLAEAGYPGGFDLTVAVPANYQPHLDAAEAVAEQLAEIGVRTEIAPVEWEEWLTEVLRERDYQAALAGVDAAWFTPRALLGRYASGADNNFIQYRDAAFDDLLTQAEESTGAAERSALYRRMAENLAENAASVYLQDLEDLVGVRKGLEGVVFYPVYVLDLSGLEWTA